jgi:hypothetical protein
MTNEPPPPDVLDTRGRMRRLVISFVIAVIVASVAYGIAYGMAGKDTERAGRRRGAYNFIIYVTGGAFAGSFALAQVIQNAIEKKRYLKSLELPTAKLRK